MKTTRRKLGYYYVNLSNPDDEVTLLKDVINAIMSKQKTERRQSVDDDRFYFMSSCRETFNNQNWLNLTFKFAQTGFRPNHIDRDTLEERENSKTMSEGDGIDTHIALRIHDNKIYLLLEEFQGGVTIQMLIRYLNTYAKEIERTPIIRFGFEIVIKDNFMDELEKAMRINEVELFYDKSIIGSDAYNYAERSKPDIGTVRVIFNAKRKKSLKEMAKKLGTSLVGHETRIKNMRLKGQTEDGSPLQMSLDIIKHKEYIRANKSSDTGVIISDNIFEELNNKLHEFIQSDILV